MGSKKNKKVKQEADEPVEIEKVEKLPKSPKRKRHHEDIVTDEQDDTDVQTPSKPKKKKKKNKTLDNSVDEVALELPEEKTQTNGSIKSEQIKEEKILEINSVVDLKVETDPIQEVDEHSIHKEVDMPQNDSLELIRRIAVVLPENDNLSYKCRAVKLPWDEIAFSHYSAQECKDTWYALQKNVRAYRILHEVLEDAKAFVINPLNQLKGKKKIHPDMPTKPPTGYQLFYKKKKPSLLSEKLDLAETSKQISQMFKALSAEKRMKYERQAAQLKAKYEEEIQIFYENHPELAECMKSENKPVRPSTPFALYFKNQLRKNSNASNNDINSDGAFKEQCKAQWKELSMKKKMLWITKAEQDKARYEEELKEYCSKHPNYIPLPFKNILTKEEIALKEKYSGKPDKPPSNSYSLFSKKLLQSEEIKKISAKERMNHIATLWKNCSEEERNKYKAEVDELTEQYKKDYEKYLESLPEDKKQLELQKNAPKKKNKSENPDKKKGKAKMEKVPEPATPPISAFRYFATSKNLQDRKIAKKEWKKLSEEEQNMYEKKLVEIKREYILQFEKFLNSLSKDELEQFSKTKQELKFNSEDFVDDDSSSSSSEDEDNSDDE